MERRGYCSLIGSKPEPLVGRLLLRPNQDKVVWVRFKSGYSHRSGGESPLVLMLRASLQERKHASK